MSFFYFRKELNLFEVITIKTFLFKGHDLILFQLYQTSNPWSNPLIELT